MKFVALGVSPEIVMIVEDQDARFFTHSFTEEIRRGEPADSAADHDQVIGLAG